MRTIIATLARPIIFLYHKTHWFTDAEAWAVFRFFAIGEAVTWLMLISAIVYRRIGLPEAPSVVSFAGHVHGLMMMVYCLIIVLVARSMEWRFGRMCLAVAAGIPPFGTIIFEQIVAWRRKHRPVYVAPPAGVDE